MLCGAAQWSIWLARQGARVTGIDLSARQLAHARRDLIARFGVPRPGLRIGCEPQLVEYNHKYQSFIGGQQYRKPTGLDANSRDIELRDSRRASPSQQSARRRCVN